MSSIRDNLKQTESFVLKKSGLMLAIM